jgi:pyridoxal 5-phosphate dependent beta-lyase
LSTHELRAVLASTDTLPEPWRGWARQRPTPEVVHLDSAAAGRSSRSVLHAAAEHAIAEARWGAYVAAEHAAPGLARLRADVGQLLGIAADGVAWTDSARTSLARLLSAWPFEGSRTIGVLDSEWGPNLEAFQAGGLSLVALPADGFGRLDLDAFERLLKTAPPTVIHLTQVAAHRGLVQPIASAAALCREHGVPLWVDASQALGHVDTGHGADAVYATGRKWLGGPRGVGILAIAEPRWAQLSIRRPALLGDDVPPVQALESSEANLAGRVGLAEAVQEHLLLGPVRVWRRLAEVGQLARDALAGTPGWEVVDDFAQQCAVVALRPIAGQDVAKTRRRLLDEHRILTTASLPARAPRELAAPLLRLSPHVDCRPAVLEALVAALAAG